VPLQEDNSRNIVPYIRTIVHKESFFPSTIRLWNPLPEATAAALDLNLDRGSGQLLFERYQTGSLSNWCWQGIPNTGGLWEETVFVEICG
jgi:hypothetical protein